MEVAPLKPELKNCGKADFYCKAFYQERELRLKKELRLSQHPPLFQESQHEATEKRSYSSKFSVSEARYSAKTPSESLQHASPHRAYSLTHSWKWTLKDIHFGLLD